MSLSSNLTATTGGSGSGSAGLGGTNVFDGTTGSNGAANTSDDLECYQSANVSFSEAGVYSNYSFSLSSFALIASNDLSQDEVQTSADSYTASGATDTGADYSGSGSDTFRQETDQWQGGEITEEGTYGGGSFALSSVTFDLNGSQDFTYNKTSNSSWSGGYAGYDDYTLTDGANGDYSVSAEGSYALGCWTLSAYTFSGGSSGTDSATDDGLVAGMGYHHNYTVNESDQYDESGTFGGGSWNFTNYTRNYAMSDIGYDWVAGSSDSFYTSDNLTVDGNGGAGVQQEVIYGSYYWNGRSTSFTLSSTRVIALAAPPLPTFLPEIDAAPSLSNGPPTAAAAQNLMISAVSQPLAANASGLLQAGGGGLAGSGGMAGGAGGVLVQAQTSEGGPPGVPMLGGAGAGGNVWLTGGGLVLQAGPWGWLQQAQGAVWTAVSKPYNDLWLQAQSATKFNPLALAAGAAWQGMKSYLPPNLDYNHNLGWYIGQGFDFINGILDTITAGLWARLRNWLDSQLMQAGLGGLSADLGIKTDYSSGGYKLGTYVGMVANIVMLAMGGEFAVVRLLQLVAAGGEVWNAYDDMQAGNFTGALRHLALAATFAVGASGAEVCELPGELQAGVRVVQAEGGLAAIYDSASAFASGNVGAGLQALLEAGIDFAGALSACFAGDMLLDTASGKRRADTIAVGDLLWSRAEDDPEGELAPEASGGSFCP